MNLLITGGWKHAKENIPNLVEMGHDVVFLQNESDALPCDPAWVEGVVGNGIFLSHPIMNFTNLRYIQLTSAGYDRVPMDYIKEHKIQIHNARGVYSVPMAEFAVAGVLALYKKLASFLESQRDHEWRKQRDLMELSGQTVLILGFGSVGRECAKRFKAFGTKNLAVDIRKPKGEFDVYYPVVELAKALSCADVIILTLPLTDKTKGMFCASTFSCCKRGAVLVNIARGALVCEDDLVEALKTKVLSGAVLDVFDEEPLPKESSLWQMDQVLISPHNSFVSPQNAARLFQVITGNLTEYCNRGIRI